MDIGARNVFFSVFILVILNKKIGITVFFVWGLSIVFVNLYFNNLVFPASFYFNSHNLEFLIGMGVAYLVKLLHMNLLSQKTVLIIIIIGISIFLINGINLNYNYIDINAFMTILLFGLSSSVIIFGLVKISNPKNKNIFFKSLLLLGSASYSIYLIHNPLISVLNRIVQKLNLEKWVFADIIYLGIICICICIGVLFHLIIEKPMLKYLRGTVNG